MNKFELQRTKQNKKKRPTQNGIWFLNENFVCVDAIDALIEWLNYVFRFPLFIMHLQEQWKQWIHFILFFSFEFYPVNGLSHWCTEQSNCKFSSLEIKKKKRDPFPFGFLRGFFFVHIPDVRGREKKKPNAPELLNCNDEKIEKLERERTQNK